MKLEYRAVLLFKKKIFYEIWMKLQVFFSRKYASSSF